MPVPLPAHVWLVPEISVRPPDPQPGILLEWAHRADGWWGLVLHTWADGLHFRWVRATDLRPG